MTIIVHVQNLIIFSYTITWFGFWSNGRMISNRVCHAKYCCWTPLMLFASILLCRVLCSLIMLRFISPAQAYKLACKLLQWWSLKLSSWLFSASVLLSRCPASHTLCSHSWMTGDLLKQVSETPHSRPPTLTCWQQPVWSSTVTTCSSTALPRVSPSWPVAGPTTLTSITCTRLWR